MRSLKRIMFVGCLMMAGFANSLSAQLPNSLYFMPGLPQTHRINPATQPAAGLYLGFPALTPLRLQFTSSSFGVSDFLIPSSNSNVLITPLHPDASKGDFLNNFRNVNFITSDLGVTLASIGFRAGKNYFSFNISSSVNAGFYYPKGIFELPINGITDNTILLSGFGIDMTAFNEYSMGWSREDLFLKNLDIGIRGKILSGMANIDTKKSVFEIATSEESWNLKTNYQINAAAPSFISFTDNIDDGIPVELDESYFNTFSLETITNLLGLSQPGLALDLGANYRLTPKLLLSASLLDFGGIWWRNAIEGTFDFSWDFEGVEANPFTGIDTSFISTLTDSLLNAYDVNAGSAYFSRLNTKFLIGASYYPIEKIGFGILSRTEFLNDRISQQFTGSVNMTTGKFANLTLSYSYIAQKFNNIGAGVSFNMGPFNMYFVSDNFLSTVLKPLDARSMNLWFGLNMTFGWRKIGKKAEEERFRKMDKPMIH